MPLAPSRSDRVSLTAGAYKAPPSAIRDRAVSRPAPVSSSTLAASSAHTSRQPGEIRFPSSSRDSRCSSPPLPHTSTWVCPSISARSYRHWAASSAVSRVSPVPDAGSSMPKETAVTRLAFRSASAPRSWTNARFWTCAVPVQPVSSRVASSSVSRLCFMGSPFRALPDEWCCMYALV